MSDEILEGMIRQSNKDKLPILKIVSTKDVPYVEMKIEGDCRAIEAIVEIGREQATEEDYFNIGLTYGLKESLKKQDE
jgi:hypothetical protein